jgi:hypothetical protein
MGGVRRLLVLLAVLALAGCGSSSKQAGPTTTAEPATEPASTSAPVPVPKPQPIDPLRHPAGKVQVGITASTHLPKAGVPWRYTVRVTSQGKLVPARVYLQITSGGAVVGTVGSHLVTHGRFTDTVRWPPSARGHQFFFEAKAVASGRIGGGRYQVAVQ